MKNAKEVEESFGCTMRSSGIGLSGKYYSIPYITTPHQ